MVQFLITIHTIISILLIVVVLMQSGQGGLNSMMSGTATPQKPKPTSWQEAMFDGEASEKDEKTP